MKTWFITSFFAHVLVETNSYINSHIPSWTPLMLPKVKQVGEKILFPFMSVVIHTVFFIQNVQVGDLWS